MILLLFYLFLFIYLFIPFHFLFIYFLLYFYLIYFKNIIVKQYLIKDDYFSIIFYCISILYLGISVCSSSPHGDYGAKKKQMELFTPSTSRKSAIIGPRKAYRLPSR